MPSTATSTSSSWSDAEQLVGQHAVLAWAATSAVALGVSSTVTAALVRLLQQRYNVSVPGLIEINIAARRIAEDGLWGRGTALAVLQLIAASRGEAEMIQLLVNTGITTAFDAANDCAAISTVAKVRSRYNALRDAVTTFGNTTQGVGRNLGPNGVALLDAVRTASTAADVTSRANTVLAGLFATSAQPSVPTATVTATTQVPSGKTSAINQATQVPSRMPDVVTDVQFVAPPPLTVQGDTFGRRANLAVIIPSVFVGGLALVWLVKTFAHRGRRA